MRPFVSWLRRPKRPKLFPRVQARKSSGKQPESITVKSKLSEDSGKTVEAAPLSSSVDSNGPRSFQIPGLASGKSPTATGMREDVLLLAWLVVLLRTREDGQAQFEWAYDSPSSATIGLSSDKVMANLQSNVEEVTSAISQHVAEVTSRVKPASRPVSILLSTGVLSREAVSRGEVGLAVSKAFRPTNSPL